MLHYFAINDIHAKISSAVVQFSDSVLNQIFAVTCDIHFQLGKGPSYTHCCRMLTLALAKLFSIHYMLGWVTQRTPQEILTYFDFQSSDPQPLFVEGIKTTCLQPLKINKHFHFAFYIFRETMRTSSMQQTVPSQDTGKLPPSVMVSLWTQAARCSTKHSHTSASDLQPINLHNIPITTKRGRSINSQSSQSESEHYYDQVWQIP